MSDLTNFSDWYYRNLTDAHGIKHFTPYELIILGSRGKIRNVIPPKELWKNCVKGIIVLNQLREYFNRPINITSAYRSVEYNETIGGTPSSQHLYFRAFDITSNYISPEDICFKLMSYRDNDVFSGGIGLYKTFVHFDTRGRNATWASRQ